MSDNYIVIVCLLTASNRNGGSHLDVRKTYDVGLTMQGPRDASVSGSIPYAIQALNYSSFQMEGSW